MFRKQVSLLLLFFSYLLLVGPSVSWADDWLPVPPADLTMKDNPAAPGSHAMLLYRDLFTNDVEYWQDEYYRIKIFAEEGKKFADIQIPYVKGIQRIDRIKARTIHPDGSIAEFDGQIFDKVIVKVSGLRIQAKTFTLPDVQVGSIIEYKFRLRWPEYTVYDSRWIIHHELFTRRAVFSVKPNETFYLYWLTIRSPGNVSPQKQKGGTYGMELENIPPFKEEEFAPPDVELKGRIDLFYTETAMKKPEQFWAGEGKDWFGISEGFIGKRGAIRDEVARIVAPADTPEAKLQKLYARAQQIRNLSYERAKTEKEEKHENIKDNGNVEDVLKHGYAYTSQINRLFVAFARAAGFDAAIVRLSERDDYFFNESWLNWRQLNGEVAWVSAGGQEYYLDPGTPFCPFGFLSWEYTGVRGLKLDKNGGTWVTTPLPGPAGAVVKRTAKLKLDDEGALAGQLVVSFTGQEAILRRLIALEQDDAERKKSMEDLIKAWLPGSAKVEIAGIDGWEETEQPLEVRVNLTVPGWAASTGRRILMPVGLFHVGRRNPFEHVERVHPVYFRHPYADSDDITIELPGGLRVESLPTAANVPRDFGAFGTRYTRDASSVRIERMFHIDGILFQVPHYPALRALFESARSSDEEQIVLSASTADQKQ